jgi:hypothetical protein
VNVSGLAALPQLSAGKFSVQLATQLEVRDPVQAPSTPPSMTRVPQQTVPVAHWSVPLLPVQSRGSAGRVHVAAQLSAFVPRLKQHWSPAGHGPCPPSLDRHIGAAQTPAPLHATAQGAPVSCHAPAALQDWGCRGPLHCICPGAHDPVQVPLTQVWLLQADATTQVPVALHVSGWLPAVQLVDPAAHTPVHAPATHVVLEHAFPLFCHVPPEPQSCGCWPLHCT